MGLSVRSFRMALALCVLLPFTAGCSATKVSRSDEIRIGQQAAQEMEQRYPVHEDARVSRIGQRLAALSTRPDLPWRFRVLDRPDVNAVSLPGGPIYIYQGLLSQIGSDDDMLAAVLGHEIGHVEGRHAAKQMERSQWFGLGSAVLDRIIGGDVGTISQVIGNLELLSYSRQQEYQSDDRSILLLRRAGYDPEGMVRLLELLNRQGGGGTSIGWLRTHPTSENRIRRAEQKVAETGR